MRRTTGQTISQTVENMLADAVSEDREALANHTVRQVYSQKLNALADYLGVSRPYMPRKIKSGTWSPEDLDRLAIYFQRYPMDFVPGPNDDWGPDDEASESVRQTEGDRHSSTPEGGNPENVPPGPEMKKTE